MFQLMFTEFHVTAASAERGDRAKRNKKCLELTATLQTLHGRMGWLEGVQATMDPDDEDALYNFLVCVAYKLDVSLILIRLLITNLLSVFRTSRRWWTRA
jgi:hypothetical protein